MSLITGDDVTISFSSTPLLAGADFQLEQGRCVALIGANGCGKSSLLAAITGGLAHAGIIHRRKGLSVNSLAQTPDIDPELSVREAVADCEVQISDLRRSIDRLHSELSVGGMSLSKLERAMKHLGDLEHEFDSLGGYDLDRKTDMVLGGLGLGRERSSQTVASLSGGELNRLALARLLLRDADLWLLDEPTNHLDLAGISFLEDFLVKSKACAVVVSHDRFFLDSVTDETWEIEGCRLWKYPAPYSKSRLLREQRIESAGREYEQQKEYIAKQEEYLRKYGAGQRAKEARGRAKRLARLERLKRPADRIRSMAFNLPRGKRLGDRVLETDALDVGIGGKTLLKGLELEMLPGEALGVVGANGCGKTTLLRTLLGEHNAVSGSFAWGGTTDRAVLHQHDELPDTNLTPLSYLQSLGSRLTRSELLDLLGAMLFSQDASQRAVSMLSGGERKRLLLTRLLMAGKNVLLFDEPTNHLDTQSREALEGSLTSYDGCIIAVSHDRYFLDKLADRILWIESDGSWRIYDGGYSDAAKARTRFRPSHETPTPKQSQHAAFARKRKKKLRASADGDAEVRKKSKHSWRKTEDLESMIISLEERQEALYARLSDPVVSRDREAVRAANADIDELQNELKELEDEYGRRDS